MQTVRDGERIHVFLIEDNPVDVRLISELLLDAPDGHIDLTNARTLAEGLKHLSTERADVILLDLGLPDSQGFDTFHTVATHVPHLPIIVLTVMDDAELGRMAVREGAQDFITKDILTKGELFAGMFVRTIDYAIERKQVEEALVIAKETLEERVHERSAQLAEINSELTAANERLIATNEELRHEIEHRLRAEEAVRAQANRISTLNSVIKVGNSADDLQAAMKSMLDAALDMLHFDVGLIYLMDDAGDVQYRYSRGVSMDALEHSPYAPLLNTTTEALYRDEPMQMYIKDSSLDSPQSLKAGAVIPLMVKEHAIGHFAVFCYDEHLFSPSEKDLLELIGQEAGAVISRLQAEEQAHRYSEHLEQVVEERTAKLKNAERLSGVGETASMIGHDLRNPLQSLQYIVDLQKLRFDGIPPEERGVKDWENVEELCDKIREQVFYMEKIVGDLQDFARPVVPEFEMLSVKALFNDVVDALPRRDGVCVTVDAENVYVLADPRLMHRMLANLILNAMQAMPDGGDLSLSAFAEGGGVTVNISDTGIGIPDELKYKLFSPLVTGKAKGTGLGLAVVKRIVDAHSGRITFISGDTGTTFSVWFPVNR